MRRTILVLGIGGSGTSSVAGALHEMGCPMGHEGHLGKHPAGFSLYEDHEFYGAFRQKGVNPELHALILSHQRDPIWGWKNTLTWKALPWVFVWLRDLGNEPRVVAVHRTLTASIRAREQGRCPPGQYYPRAEAEVWAVRAMRGYYEALDTAMQGSVGVAGCPVHHVGYEDLTADPTGEVERLAGFAFRGLDVQPDIAAAVAQIRRA